MMRIAAFCIMRDPVRHLATGNLETGKMTRVLSPASRQLASGQYPLVGR